MCPISVLGWLKSSLLNMLFVVYMSNAVRTVKPYFVCLNAWTHDRHIPTNCLCVCMCACPKCNTSAYAHIWCPFAMNLSTGSARTERALAQKLIQYTSLSVGCLFMSSPIPLRVFDARSSPPFARKQYVSKVNMYILAAIYTAPFFWPFFCIWIIYIFKPRVWGVLLM